VIENRTRAAALARRSEVAKGMLRRGLGLMGRRGWAASDGMVLTGCNSIHTFFMRMPIDVVYLDKGNRVLRADGAVKPWRLGPIVWKAKTVVELPAGTIERTGTKAGDLLQVVL
jgi:uncharacterized membrane protein (UPF0127 family)